MCIIAVKPEGKRLTDDEIDSCFMCNPDGAGFLVWDKENNKLICQKGFFNVKDLKKAFEPYQNHSAIVHFRIGTAGARNTANCHPFLINENIGFVHNGHVNIKRDKMEYSDTWHLNEYLQGVFKYDPQSWYADRFKREFEENKAFMGWSLFAFMDSDGHVEIINEKHGEWDEGRWFSNSGYRRLKGWKNATHGRGWNIYYPYEYEEDDFEVTAIGKPQKSKVADNEIPDTRCARCKTAYYERYRNWDMDLEMHVCDECAKSESGYRFDLIPSLSALNKVDEDEVCSRSSAVPRRCEACDEEPIGDLFMNNETRSWLCEKCCVAWHDMTQEERVNFIKA